MLRYSKINAKKMQDSCYTLMNVCLTAIKEKPGVQSKLPNLKCNSFCIISILLFDVGSWYLNKPTHNLDIDCQLLARGNSISKIKLMKAINITLAVMLSLQIIFIFK